MPYTDEELETRKAIANRFQMQLNSMAEADGASPDDPNYILLEHRLNKVNRELEEHYSATRPVGPDGKLTEDAQSTTPVRSKWRVEDKLPFGASNQYFFEPSVAEVRHRIENDPALVERLGLQEWLQQYEPPTPSVNVGPMDPTTGNTVNIGVQQSRSRLDALTASSDPTSTYARVADEMWKERLADAEARGVPISRYSKVKLGKDPLGWIQGGVSKVFNDVVAPVAIAAADVGSLGTADLVRQRSDEAMRSAAQRLGREFVNDTPTSEEIERRNPNLANAARVAAYMMPQQVTNLAINAAQAAVPGVIRGVSVAKNAAKAAFGAIPRTRAAVSQAAIPAAEAAEMAARPAARYAGAFVIGGAGNAAEGFIGDTARGVSSGQSVGEAASDASSNIPGNFAWGGGMSLPAEAVAQTISGYRRIRNESPNNRQLRALRAAGGDTAVIGDAASGYEAPHDMRQAVRDANMDDRSVGTAADRYADELAPQLQKSLDEQLRTERQRVEAENEAYFNHPAYQEGQPSQEAINEVLNLAKRGWTTGSVSGKQVHVDRAKLKKIGDALDDGVAEYQSFRSKARAEKLAKETGGTIIDGNTAAHLWPGRKIQPNHHVVVVGNKLNPQTLTVLEERIDEALDISRNRRGTSNEDPVYTPLNKAIKSIRDRFEAWFDDAGNLVAPPGWVAPSQPAPRPSQARRARAPKPKNEPLIPVDEGLPPETTASAPPGTEDPFPLEHQRVEPLSGDITPRRGPPETIGSADVRMEPETIGSGEVQMEPETVSSRNARAMPPSTEAGEPPFTERTPSTKRSITPNDGNTEPLRRPDERGGLERRLDAELGDPDQSLPAPGPQSWNRTVNELQQWYDEIVTPGAPARSAEAKRMAELIEQQRQIEMERARYEAEGKDVVSTERGPLVPENPDDAMEMWVPYYKRIRERLGPLGDEDMAELVGNGLRQYFPNLTEEEIKGYVKKYGPFIAGLAVDELSGEEDGYGVTAAAAVGGLTGGGGGRKKGPGKKGGKKGSAPPPTNAKQVEAVLDDGTKVTGFSAMRRLQHERLKRLNDVGAGVAKDDEKGIRRKLLNFNQYSGTPEDRMLLEEAKRLGLEDALYKVAATHAYQSLREQGTGGVAPGDKNYNANPFQWIINAAKPRVDAAGRALAGDPVGKYRAPELDSNLETGMRELFNLSGGRPGARFGNDTNFLRDYIWSLMGGNPDSEDQQQ